MNMTVIHQQPRVKHRVRFLPKEMRIPLTPAEVDMLYWLSIGKSQIAISEILGISLNTTYQRMHRAMNKLCTPTAAGAVGAALRRGLIK